jgi:hypothetical protein
VLRAVAAPIVVVSLACSGFSVHAQGMWPQQDFRDATAQDLPDAWREADPYRFAVIQGDFDGDGLADQARLQVSPRTHEAAVFVFLAKPDKRYERVQLLRMPDNAARALGLATVKAGRYTTACGKSTTFQCKADEPQQVTLERDGLSVFRNGGTTTYYWWDAGARRFAQAIITE